MAFPTSVNPQITDVVTAENQLGGTRSDSEMMIGELYMDTMQALSIAAYDAVTAQQQANIAYQAATASAVAVLLGEGVAPDSPDDLCELNTQQLDERIERLKQQLEQARDLQHSFKQGENT